MTQEARSEFVTLVRSACQGEPCRSGPFRRFSVGLRIELVSVAKPGFHQTTELAKYILVHGSFPRVVGKTASKEAFSFGVA